MRIAFFDTHEYDRTFFDKSNQDFKFDISYFKPQLNEETVKLAEGFPVVCAFVNDHLTVKVLRFLKAGGTELIALRSAGFNHVDMVEARKLGIKVVRVPEYSPYAVAEHAVALILTLNRKTHKAYQRVRELNFSLVGLVGFDLHGSTIGVVGTGKIGRIFCKIMKGFGCRVLAYDMNPHPEAQALGVEYVSLQTLLEASDIVSLHVPLTTQTHHLIDARALKSMKAGAILVNTGRGALVDSKALIKSLKSQHLGGAALDVYEEEEGVFFEDLSNSYLKDDVLARLLSFPNVILTSHQAFLTREALGNIAHTTLSNIKDFEQGEPLANEVV